MTVKAAAVGAMHIGRARSARDTLSGRMVVAGAIAFVEPVRNTVAQDFFDGWWDRRGLPGAAGPGRATAAVPG